MPRKINDTLITRMLEGDLSEFFNYVQIHTQTLRLEARLKGKANIYYKKCKILDLGPRSYHIDGKYFDDKKEPKNIKEMILDRPNEYFEYVIPIVDRWLDNNHKDEFETQQNIARDNQNEYCKYLILDMEYNFSQETILEENRVKQAGFDLLGIERESGKVILFEVKRGLDALTGKSGIKDHIKDFEEYLYGANSTTFRNILNDDVEHIIRDKIRLGLIDLPEMPDINTNDEVEFIFIYEPNEPTLEEYIAAYEEEYRQSESVHIYETIFVSKNNYELV
jgi:hypothetical protein